jgi:hypothetical protein
MGLAGSSPGIWICTSATGLAEAALRHIENRGPEGRSKRDWALTITSHRARLETICLLDAGEDAMDTPPQPMPWPLAMPNAHMGLHCAAGLQGDWP